MPRRKQKLSRSKSRTAWLAWLAWAIVGSIFMFEDTEGGSGTFALILTAPFWFVFVLWPFLWIWLKTRRDPALVEIDDDITAAGRTARLVQKEGVRYVETAPFAAAFGVAAKGTVRLPGGDEAFTPVEDIRALVQRTAKDAPVRQWLAVVDSIPSP